MHNVTATFRNGRVELMEPVDWPDGTCVEVRPVAVPGGERSRLGPPMTQWPPTFFDELRRQWGNEPFDRPPQGEAETQRSQP
jgi:hypothetical protein